jgi:hypothetical protein
MPDHEVLLLRPPKPPKNELLPLLLLELDELLVLGRLLLELLS